MPTVLVVSDNPDSADLLRTLLESAGYGVYCTADADAKSIAAFPDHNTVNLVLLDVHDTNPLPFIGRCKRQKRTASAPILVVTSLESEPDLATVLELGADDCLVRPLRPRELLARVKAVTHRSTAVLPAAQARNSGPLILDASSQTVTCGDEQIVPTGTEFRILDLLVRHAGRVVSRQQVLQACRKGTRPVRARSVDVHIRSLRKKLKGAAGLILTVRSEGYRLKTLNELR